MITDPKFSASITSRLSGSPALVYKEIFSLFSLAADISVYNANLWGGGATDILSQFTAIAWSSSGGEIGNPVAVTVRHCVCSYHAGITNGSVLTFIATDGTRITRTVGDVTVFTDSGNLSDTQKIQVLWLTADLPGTITLCKLFDPLFVHDLAFHGMLVVKSDQENKALVTQLIQNNGSSSIIGDVPSDSAIHTNYYEDTISGDSGSFIIALHDTSAVLIGHVTTGAVSASMGGTSASYYVQNIIDAINDLNTTHSTSAQPSILTMSVIYNCQDNAANHNVLDSGGGSKTGTAAANTSTFSTTSGAPGHSLPRAFTNPASISVPTITIDGQGDFVVAGWFSHTGADSSVSGVMGASGGTAGIWLQRNGSNYDAAFEDDNGNVTFSNAVTIGSLSSIHHLVFSNSSGTCSVYKDKVLLGTFDLIGDAIGTLTIDAICNSGADPGVDSAVGLVAGLTVSQGVTWDQTQVNTNFAIGGGTSPTIVGGTTAIYEITAGDTAVGTISATGDATISFSITGGANAALFAINSSSGVLISVSPAVAGTYEVIITAHNSTAPNYSQTITVIVDSASPTGTGATTGPLLLQDGSRLLLQDGSKLLLQGGIVEADRVSIKSAANTPAILTLDVAPESRIRIEQIEWSYSAAPTGGNLKVEQTDGTVIFEQDISTTRPAPKDPHGMQLDVAAGQELTITLAAGGDGIVGCLNVLRS